MSITIVECSKDWPSPASVSFIFVFSNKHYNFYIKYMWKKFCPSSIWCRDSNPQPSEHESPPITTRPRLLPFHCLDFVWNVFSSLLLLSFLPFPSLFQKPTLVFRLTCFSKERKNTLLGSEPLRQHDQQKVAKWL